jgi:hypothetical protein
MLERVRSVRISVCVCACACVRIVLCMRAFSSDAVLYVAGLEVDLRSQELSWCGSSASFPILNRGSPSARFPNRTKDSELHHFSPK